MSGTMSVRAAAIALGVHENTIRNWIDAGQLEAVRLPTGVRRPVAQAVLDRAEITTDAELRDLANRLDDAAEILKRQAAVLDAAAAEIRASRARA